MIKKLNKKKKQKKIPEDKEQRKKRDTIDSIIIEEESQMEIKVKDERPQITFNFAEKAKN